MKKYIFHFHNNNGRRYVMHTVVCYPTTRTCYNLNPLIHTRLEKKTTRNNKLSVSLKEACIGVYSLSDPRIDSRFFKTFFSYFVIWKFTGIRCQITRKAKKNERMKEKTADSGHECQTYKCFVSLIVSQIFNRFLPKDSSTPQTKKQKVLQNVMVFWLTQLTVVLSIFTGIIIVVQDYNMLNNLEEITGLLLLWGLELKRK